MTYGRELHVVPVFCLFCVALRSILRGALCFKVFSVLLVFFLSPLSIVITSLLEEGAGLCASRAFVCFARVLFLFLSLARGF